MSENVLESEAVLPEVPIEDLIPRPNSLEEADI